MAADSLYAQLHATIVLLASPPEVQIRYLADASRQAQTAVLADDIAEDFDHWMRSAAQLTGGPHLDAKTLADLSTFNDMFDGFGPNTADWSPAALSTSVKWQAIRDRAQHLLASMDAHYPAGASSALPSGVWIPSRP